jgi:hypothetical protein
VREASNHSRIYKGIRSQYIRYLNNDPFSINAVQCRQPR